MEICRLLQKTDKAKVASDFNGGFPLPEDYKVTPLKYIYATPTFIGTLIGVLHVKFSGHWGRRGDGRSGG